MTTLPERLQDVIAELLTCDACTKPGVICGYHSRKVQAAQALQAASGGWVLVPVEPTEAMLDAPPNAWPADAKVTYAAMLSATPSPTAALQAGEV